REAAKISTRYLLQRETDLRTLAETPAIPSYFNNKNYGLTEEAEVSRRELERSFKRFADRSNAIEPVYVAVRYVDPRGDEVAKVVDGRIMSQHGSVADAPFFAAGKQLEPGNVFLSPLGARRTYAMPVYQPATPDRPAAFLGSVVLDFNYPIEEFRRTTAVIGWTFVVITAVSLGLAVLLVVNRVARLTNPIRR